jgi:hypothetical protein
MVLKANMFLMRASAAEGVQESHPQVSSVMLAQQSSAALIPVVQPD